VAIVRRGCFCTIEWEISMKFALFTAAGVAALCGSASAQVTLNGAFSVDNGFTAYISTSPTL
jgi:hypothetical protein